MYLISTLNELLWISEQAYSDDNWAYQKIFLQTADIDASETAFWASKQEGTHTVPILLSSDPIAQHWTLQKNRSADSIPIWALGSIIKAATTGFLEPCLVCSMPNAMVEI